MNSNIVRMTLTNESVTFYSDGIYVQPLLSDGFWFAGTPDDLINIMVYHKELDIERCLFRVRSRNQRFTYISPSVEGY